VWPLNNSKKHTPEGAQDCLPQECYLKKKIESELRSAFIRYGYDEVETPAFEYYDVFARGVGSYLQENMIKFFDHKGRILALKPDITVPIARMVSAYYAGGNTPKRFFYIQNAYSFETAVYGRSSEFTQAGIELIGESGCGADAEVISMAVRALLQCGIQDFKIDIGQVMFFKTLIEGEELSDDEIDSIRHQIDIKNMFELENLLDGLKISNGVKEKLKNLPILFGGEEVLFKAQLLGETEGCKKALDNLRQVYSLLCAYGLKDYISIDLGMLHDIGYYSGIIFRGLCPGIGFPVLSGGRYDSLLAEFDCDMPATGFAMGIKRVMTAMEKRGLLQGFYTTDCVVGAAPESAAKAYGFCEELRNQGKRVLYSSECDANVVSALKKEYGAEQACFFDDRGNLCVVE
jgi:ATP phosphoribosyltransferase regulatory subunit